MKNSSIIKLNLGYLYVLKASVVLVNYLGDHISNMSTRQTSYTHLTTHQSFVLAGKQMRPESTAKSGY